MKRFFTFTLLIIFGTMLLAQKQITLDDIWKNGTFQTKGISSIRSLNDGEHYTILTSKGIEKFAYKTGKSLGLIVDFSSIGYLKDSDVRIENYQFNATEEKVLLQAGSDYIYRHSFVADMYLYNLKTKQFTKLTEDYKQRLTEFSPDGTKIAYVRDNNLFIKDLSTLAETQITGSGEVNYVINGTTDWVYEEEFAITKGFFWSPEGNQLAFYRFDESQVKEFSMTMWGELYPEEYRYKYPKAGDDNSIVDVLVYNLNTKSTTKLNVGSENDQYIPRVQWTKDNNTLAIMRMNRLQNKMEILFANIPQNTIEVVYSEEKPTYIDVPSVWKFLNDKKQFLFTSEKDGYNHIYLYDFVKKELKQLESGNYDIASVSAIDEKNKTVYYLSSESSPINKELYSVRFDGKGKQRISKRTGSHSVNFSKNFRYYINAFTDANTPPLYTVNDNKGKEIHTMEDNAAVKVTMSEFGNETKEFGTFTTSEGVDLNYWIIKPANFDSSKKYPVLFYVYGGPGNQTVTNSWGGGDYFWYRMLAQKGYICISVDGRGTGSRGEEFKKCTYKELGKLETIDQIEAAKYFGSQSWVDETRIGIFGWSYGGYMSSLCITKGADYFKSAIAVAPVTTWRYYDNIYTERFMQRPQENANGYDDNSPINHVEKLKGNYLLIHGTADDNVHFQNAMDISTALINADKQFEQFSYPNKNHFITGGNTRHHLYTMMTSFLERKL